MMTVTSRWSLVALISAMLSFVAALALHAQPTAAPAPPAPASQDLIQRGHYLATAADCTACHTKPGGKPFAGGYAIASPMGTIYSTNITPSRIAGIGAYSLADFTRLLRKGIRADGAHVYPAMPYTAYTSLTDQDVAALYAYFMHGVAPVDSRPPKTRLPFPFNLRLSMAAWNLLFLDEKRFKPDPSRSASWNRGAYLVGSLEHCSACHSPRNFLMGEEHSKAFSGGSLGTWYAPNITSDVNGGIGSWSHADIVRYLRSGITGHARAGGGMAEAVSDSLQYLSATDLDAIATYVQSIAAVPDRAQSRPRTAFGHPARFEPAVRGGAVTIDAPTAPDGPRLFSGNCASCHGATGAGSRDGAYPALFGNTTTGAARADNLIATILTGVHRNAAGRDAAMPAFGPHSRVQSLSDGEIASLGTYVMTSMGNERVRITAAEVATRRRGGATAPLVLAVRWGMPLGAIVVIALIAFVLIWRKRRARGRTDALTADGTG